MLLLSVKMSSMGLHGLISLINRTETLSFRFRPL